MIDVHDVGQLSLSDPTPGGQPGSDSWDSVDVGSALIWTIGRAEVYSQRASFDLDPVVGARGQIFDATHGLLYSSPITLVSLGGLVLLGRRKPGLAWYLGASSVALFLFYSTYDQWNASHYGNRFLMPVIAFGGVPLAVLSDRAIDMFRRRRIGGLLASEHFGRLQPAEPARRQEAREAGDHGGQRARDRVDEGFAR